MDKDRFMNQFGDNTEKDVAKPAVTPMVMAIISMIVFSPGRNF